MQVIRLLLPVFLTLSLLPSCTRTRTDVWDDTKTCGRYMGKGLRSLGGKQTHSRQVQDPSAFSSEEAFYDPPEFDPPSTEEQTMGLYETNYPQARELPGDVGSTIPPVQVFADPSLNPELASTFQHIHFHYDSPTVGGTENLQILHNVADYLRNHPGVYLLIEGHCDERGPESYNFALGAQRANAVRNLLIDQGVHPDHLFTISYGKDRPLLLEHNEDCWRKNRRAEMKIYRR